VASNDFGAGTPRVPFVLFRGSSPLEDASSVRLTAFDLSSGTPDPGWTGPAVPFTDYDTPYWVAYPELPSAGYWGLGAEVTLADGQIETGQFSIEVLADPSAPEVGETPPASQNRTLETEPELARITSDPQPEPALYEQTVAEALASGQPSVVTFATPAYCASRLCAPVVDSVKAARELYPEQVNWIHIEVYKTFEPLVYADERDEWRLTSEPWTFVLDAQGQVAARLGGPVSTDELLAALQPLLGP
jgi:hypothetical protein